MKNLSGILSLSLFLITATANRSWTEEALGLKLPPGFRVSVYGDESVANDTYAMTLDAKGRVVVTTRGVIKTLHDDGKTGKADRFTAFSKTETGGMGLCFDGNTLLYCGDGWLSRLQDANGDGQADGPAEHILPLAFTEHGGHAIRKGPDGFWYVIGGNDSGIGPGHANLPGSPVKKPEAGALLRLSPDLKGSEVISHGFRNPYDFDFNPAGEIFTYDSDVERDIFLPWYAPTRVYHVAIGGHHGWRLTGYLRSWPRPDYDPGTVDILTNIGRGSPTGVVCYRHEQFPDHYQGGLFVLDWTFGKVYFLKLTPDGGTYKSETEVFIEPQGTSGFAPTDAVVAPDGALLISVGGRGTRGLVYRVEHIEGAARGIKESANPLDRVLRAHQPLDAWSRAKWEPQLERLGRQPFLEACEDQSRSVNERIRAVEILTEKFGGLPIEVATSLAKSPPPALRARTAWSVGRVINGKNAVVLSELLEDDDPHVRRESIDAKGSNPLNDSNLLSNLGHADKRVRLAAVRNATSIPEARANRLKELLRSASPQAKLSGLLAEIERSRSESIRVTTLRELLEVFTTIRDAELQLQAVRLIQRALGGYRLKDPAVEVLTAYSTQSDLSASGRLRGNILNALRPLFPSGNEVLDDEIARLLAMLEDDDPQTASKIAEFWTPMSSATRDLHFLIVFARLRAPRTDAMTRASARALVALDSKLSGREQRIKQTWNTRLGELVSLLLSSGPALGSALLNEPGFVGANHATLALSLAPEEKGEAARAFLKAVSLDPEFAWSGPLIELLAALPAKEVAPVFREQWTNMGLRDAILPKLTEHPEESDRSRFLDALDSSQPEIMRLGLSALEALPKDPAPAHLVPLVRLLRRLATEPKEKSLRSRVAALIGRQSGESFAVNETSTDTAGIRRSYDAVFGWFNAKYPDLTNQSMGSAEDPKARAGRLAKVDWNGGDASRGSVLFANRGCATCHSGARALGPDLSGVTARLSRTDLFTAIVSPSLDVAPAYRTSLIETRDGQVISGLIAFESADGLIVQTGATTTVRLATPEIVSRHISTRSLMPDQLLQGLSDRDLADLDAFLRSIPRR